MWPHILLWSEKIMLVVSLILVTINAFGLILAKPRLSTFKVYDGEKKPKTDTAN